MADGTPENPDAPPPAGGRRLRLRVPDENPKRPAKDRPGKARAAKAAAARKARAADARLADEDGDLGETAPTKTLPPGMKPYNVKPAAPPARPRRRHFFLILSFLLFVVLPSAATWFYMWNRAVDQYASHVSFSVRTEEQGSAVELLGGITELSGASTTDTDILFTYLTSQELVSRVDAQVDLREMWSRPGRDVDPIFVYDNTGTIEDLVDHWERKISVVYDSSTGLIDLEVLAFDPDDAHRIATVLLDECTKMINALSKIAQEDSIRFTREELANSVERLKTARQALTQFRNRTQIVDPSIDTQNQMGLLITLQQQLADALIEFDLLQDTTRENDPRVTQAQRRIDVIENRINEERRKLGLGDDGGTGEAYANLVGEYEGLIVDREFAEAAYTTALAANDAALAEVRKQSRYLAAHVQPTRAEKAEHPKRQQILLLVTLFAFFSWTILCLVYYSLRDRR